MYRHAAHVYDAVYAAAGKDYDAESSHLIAELQRRNPGAETLLDVGCGTAAHLAYLASRYHVTGVDLDAGMLEVARRRLPGVEFVQADMRDFDLGRTFDAIVCLFSTIGHAADAEELSAAVSSMARHLAPAGVLVVDGWIRPEAWREPGLAEALSGPAPGVGDGAVVARVARSERSGDRTSLELHHLVGTNDGVEHIVEHHELTLFSDEQYRGALESAGLAVEVTESPMAGRDRYFATRSR